MSRNARNKIGCFGIWKRCEENSEAWKAEQRRIRDEANAKRAVATKAQHEVSNPRAGETVNSGPSTSSERSKLRGKGSTEKAAASQTNRCTVERMDRLEKIGINQPRISEIWLHNGYMVGGLWKRLYEGVSKPLFLLVGPEGLEPSTKGL